MTASRTAAQGEVRRHALGCAALVAALLIVFAGVLFAAFLDAAARALAPVLPLNRTLRLTLVEASDGKVGSLWDKLTLSCYRFDHLNKGLAALSIQT